MCVARLVGVWSWLQRGPLIGEPRSRQDCTFGGKTEKERKWGWRERVAGGGGGGGGWGWGSIVANVSCLDFNWMKCSLSLSF